MTAVEADGLLFQLVQQLSKRGEYIQGVWNSVLGNKQQMNIKMKVKRFVFSSILLVVLAFVIFHFGFRFIKSKHKLSNIEKVNLIILKMKSSPKLFKSK